MNLALELKDVHTYYGYSHILHGVSLQVPQGKVVALLGRNGVGKTTTLRSVTGLTRTRQGSIIYKGEDISHLPPHTINRKGIALVPQGRRLFNSLTVLEHLEVFKRPGSRWDLESIMEFFPRLAERTKHKGGELSGGEQQMLAIARALMTNPELLVMDEPTEGLAPLLVREVGRLIHQIKDQGYPILITEQKLRFALDIADEVYIMSKGAIVYHGLPKDLAKDKEIQHTFLGV